MKYLLDTQILLWAAQEPERLSTEARILIDSERSVLFFSAASLWEIAIKAALKRPYFVINPERFHRRMLANGYNELPVTGAHAAALMGLSDMHKDPFDRMLLVQAIHEGLTLVTADAVLARYDGPVMRV